MEDLSPLVVERLTRYHRLLAEGRGPTGAGRVTSARIAAALEVDATQVRKDLTAIGLRGRGRVGFDIDQAVTALRSALGFDRSHPAVLVGAGHLGRALLAYRGFARYGLKIVAAFDIDPARIGDEVGGCRVRSARGLRTFVLGHHIRLAILATSVDAAQRVTDRLVSAGVTALWNFAPIHLDVPCHVSVRDEHISVGLSQLTSRP